MDKTELAEDAPFKSILPQREVDKRCLVYVGKNHGHHCICCFVCCVRDTLCGVFCIQIYSCYVVVVSPVYLPKQINENGLILRGKLIAKINPCTLYTLFKKN